LLLDFVKAVLKCYQQRLETSDVTIWYAYQ